MADPNDDQKPADKQQTVNREQLAAILDLQPRRINQLAGEGIIRQHSRGKFFLIASVRAYCEFLHHSGTKKTLSEKRENLKIEREELAIAALRRQAAIEDGELCNFEEMQARSAEAMNLVASQVQFMGSIIEDKLKLDPAQAERLDVVVREVMRSIHEQFEVLGDG